MEKLKMKDLHVGMMDAKDELIKATPEVKERFIETYIIPENLDVKSFWEKHYCFITGLKGTGKTALLRYIGIMAEEELNSLNSFILFKSNFNTYDKENMIRLIDKNFVNSLENYSNADYEIIWKWLLHRHIVENISSNHGKDNLLFEGNPAWDTYEKFVTNPFPDTKFKKIQKSLAKATVEINGAIFDGNLGAKLGFEFNFDDIQTNKSKLNDAVSTADRLLADIIPLNRKIFIFVDELELSYESEESYRRDQILIRDLIISVYRMNQLFEKQSLNIKIICSVRSEVLLSVDASGKEVNKYISSYGYPIYWNEACAVGTRHPLIELFINRIRLSEKNAGSHEVTSDKIWNKWFGSTTEGQDMEQYILRLTWFRPRDIIRILTLAKTMRPSDETFDNKLFSHIIIEYSKDSWMETIEELKAKYNSEELKAIRKIFYGYYKEFTYEEFLIQVENTKKLFNPIPNVLNKPDELLDDLFRIGVIGNISKGVQRWASRGEEEILTGYMYNILVHPALRKYLCSIKNPAFKPPVNKKTTAIKKEEHQGEVINVSINKGFSFIKAKDVDYFAPLRNYKNIKNGQNIHKCKVKFNVRYNNKKDKCDEAIEIYLLP